MDNSSDNPLKPSPACLVVSYHYPPLLNSSGLLRIVSFVKALAENGWHTTVLSCDIKAYNQTHSSQLSLSPPNVNLVRCFARHTAISLSFRNKYFDWMALPDPLQSWIIPAIWRGWRLIKQHKISSLLSSYPLASAHIIAYVLCRITGVHWVADLRDPMLQADYPAGTLRRKLFAALERRIFRYASWITVTTESTARFYRLRFPQCADKIITIPNGYDASLAQIVANNHLQAQSVTLLHSGMLNKDDRDPTALLNALHYLKCRGKINADTFTMLFRAPDQTSLLQQLIDKLQLEDIVKIGAAIPYQDAIAEMQQAKALLLLQGPSCNMQIPAKLYEYLYCRRPLIALCDADGEVAHLCKQLNVGICASINDAAAIADAILALLGQLENNSAQVLTEQQLAQLSRQQYACRLTELMLPARH